jgi:hypothetical protein
VAIQGPIPLEFGQAFPDGVFAAGAFEPVRDFEKSQGDRFVQQLDKNTGLPMWAVEVIDADPLARARTVKIKVLSNEQPVMPPAPGGAPFVAVEFTGLTVTPYVNQSTNRLAYSVKATGVRPAASAPAPAGPSGQGGPAVPGSPARHGGPGRPGAEGKEAAA